MDGRELPLPRHQRAVPKYLCFPAAQQPDNARVWQPLDMIVLWFFCAN